MTVKRTTFVIAVTDLARSAEFYRDALGFEVHEIGDPGWRLFVNGECRIMAGDCPDTTPAAKIGDHSYFAYLTVEDVDAFYEQVTGEGVEIIKPLRDEPWGVREFGLRTIDGHRMMIATPLD